MKTLTNNKNTSIWKWMLLLLFMLLNVQLVCATTLSEGFDNGTTAPTGWTFTSIGGTYTTSGNYGTSSPSLKMDATSDRIVTPTLSGAATALSFWIKGQGTDASSALLVEAYNGSTWTTIANITNSLPTAATTKSYTFSSSLNYVQFRFTYTKSAGNLSFDDVNITYSSGSCTPPTLSFATPSYSKTVGNASFTQTATSNSSGAISYSSSNTAIASVNSSTGAITLGSTTGTATITATQAASGSYCAATATYTVTLSAASCTAPSLSFATASYSKILGDATFTQTATSNSGGAISYSSSNTSIASVNSSTGAITLGATTGSATITATQAASGSYCAATATYTINLSSAVASCPIIEGAMINSCGTNEGPNEFLVFSTTSAAAVSAYTLYYGSGSTPKSSASAILAGDAATSKTGSGSVVSSCTVTYVTSPSTVIPANSRVVFIPSDLDQAYDLSALCNGGNLYVAYIDRSAGSSSWSLGGNFANSAGDRYLQLVNSSSTCTSNIVSYNSSNFSSNADGNFVSWDASGNATYSNNGCSVVPPTCTTPIVTGSASINVGSGASFSSSLSGGTWSSSNTSIATVNASGVVTAIAAGTVDIMYTVGACIGVKTITTVAASTCKKYMAAWDFESSSIAPNKGNGNISTLGLGTSYDFSKKGYKPGQTNETTGIPDGSNETGVGLNTTKYPVSGSKTPAGIKIAVNTTGYSNIVFQMDMRYSNESANKSLLQYTIDGSTWITAATYATVTTGDVWFLRKYDFSAISGVNNNPNFAIRYITDIVNGISTNGATSSTAYDASNGKWRFDNIQFTADTITPILKITNPATACSPSSIDLTLPAITTGSTTGYPFTYWTNAAATSSLSTAGAVTTSNTYYIKIALKDTISGVCSVTKPVTVTINPSPTALVLTGSTICSGGTTTITSSTSVSGISYQLYNSSNTAVGTAKAGTGASLTWSGIAAGTGYYAIGTNTSTSCTSTSNTVTVKVNALPTITGSLTVCGTGTTALTGSGTAASSNPWTSATTTTATVSGTSTTGTVTGVAAGTSVITYKDNNGCTNTATVTVNALPNISGVTPDTICGSGTVTLGATASAGTINWYASLSGTTSLGTGASYTTGTLSATTNYYVDATANGCTSSSRTKVTAKVYPLSTTWTGTVSSDWNDDGNWTNGAPSCCTNVIIDSVGHYPTINSTSCCNNITFNPEAGVLGIQKLVYKKAFVKMTLQRNKWYTLTAPLKNMYSGDYYFNGGTPVSYMRLFDAINPDSLTTGGVKNIGTWTSSFANLTVPLNKGKCFTFNIDTVSWNYPHGKIFLKTNQTITFPRMNADSSLITQMIPYAASSGKPLTLIAATVARYDSAYRFTMEDTNNQLKNQTITLQKGLNLIGNPLMTHLNFDSLYKHNSSVIRNVVKFWNGSTFVSYMTGSAIGSTMGLSASSIPPMQSFFVYSDNGGSMTFDLNSDFTTTTNGRLRSAGEDPNRLYIESNNGLKASATSLALTDSAPNEFDSQDAFKLFSQYKDVPEIYTMADNKPLDINQFSTLPYTAPLGIQSSVKNTVALSFKGADSFDGIDVSLINTQTGETQNLKENTTYQYNYDGTNGEGVLFVQFKNANTESTSGVKNSTSESSIQIYALNKEKIRAIGSPADLIKDIIVYDEAGRTIALAKGISTTSHDIHVEGSNHVCIVKVITDKQVKVSKIILK
jgi:hypothetical protein